MSVLCVACGGFGWHAAAADAAPATALVTTGMEDSGYVVSGGGWLVAFSDPSSGGVVLLDLRTGRKERVDVSSAGVPGNDGTDSGYGAIAMSRTGRYVAFWSWASNLVPHVGHDDHAFLRDRKLGTTRLLRPLGSLGGEMVISGNGRYLAWGAVGHDNEAFRYDVLKRRVVRRTIGVDQTLVLGISDNGARVLVAADGGDRVWTPRTGRLTRFDQALGGGYANRGAYADALSADGRFVLFTSAASNLVPGDTNGRDVLVRNLRSHTTRRVGLGTDGSQAIGVSWGRGISASGRYVLFASSATNLTPDDDNGHWDLFLRDRIRHVTHLCTKSSTGTQTTSNTNYGQLSANGKFTFFISREPLAPGADGKDDLFARGPGC